MLLDVRGETCPYPMKKAMEAMAQLPEGEELEVLVDHPPAIETGEPAGAGDVQVPEHQAVHADRLS